MVDHQEVTWVSTRPWIRSGKGTTGSKRETMLRIDAHSVTPVQPVAVPDPGIRGRWHQYSVRTLFERMTIDVAGPFPWSDQGNWYRLIPMDNFTKWPEAFAISSQKASTVAEVLVTNLLCHFCVLQVLHSDQGHNFESRLKQEVLQCYGVNKTCTTLLHLQSDGMVNSYIRTVKEHLHKVVALHQSNWDARLPSFFLAYIASTHDTMGLTPASLVFGRELWLLPCDLLFGAPPDKEWHTINHTTNLVDHLHAIHNYDTSIWSWPVTGWKFITTDLPTLLAAMRMTNCGCIAQPAWRGILPNSNPDGKAQTRYSPG
jgi:hypothetical protein